MEHSYDLIGMHCQSCVGKIESALKTLGGVESAEVTLTPPRARLRMSRHIATEELAQAVRSAGDYALSEATSPPKVTDSPDDRNPESLYPLLLIVGYIAGTVMLIALAHKDASLHTVMRHFMAGFFLVFSFFKFLDLRGFAEAYRTYDILARAWPAWGFFYPFVELALGGAYLLNVAPIATNGATLLLMLMSSVGVLKAVLNKRAIRCACLGTVLNLPMTKITLVEDLGMAAMAAVMLAIV